MSELCDWCAEYYVNDGYVIMTSVTRDALWAAIENLEAAACRATFHLSGVAIGDEPRRARQRVRELLGMEPT